MILSNITVPLLGLVDTGVIGHLGEPYYLGATAVGSMIITFVTWFCGFLRMSTTGLAAQAFGSQDQQQVLLVLSRGLLVAFAIGISFVLLQSLYVDSALYLSGGSEKVLEYAKQYCEIRIWGLPAALANLVLLGWLLGMHKAKYAMWLLIITNSVNLSLDLLFVLVFEWGVAGVAWATLIAEYSCLFIGLAMAARTLQTSKSALLKPLFAAPKQFFARESFFPFLALNRDIVIRTLCLEICFVFITFMGARLGDTVVAANAILLNFLLLISFGLDGIAYGAEARVGRAKGAKDSVAMQLSVSVANRFNIILAIGYSLLFLLFGQYFIQMLTNIDAIVAYATEFLPWIIALPVIACWCYLYDGVYIGLTQAATMRNSMVISTFLVFFPTWFLLKDFGNHGLWAAFCFFMAARGITLYWHYKRNYANANWTD
ncbi:MATE family efflux transporter [Thalassotalea sp. HSM 43]|uniref:MATE family efflux transporter n=1 Tax=Thalassotalea sp. HSM 43 TaxID=2552945 RepID=UPI0010807861|nr:MATE family efflux transporter [Thalassotalea sp. HSM 43]QBY06151.1 MATE family efflux transporter [Thalassotalea sp. HSM 43]